MRFESDEMRLSESSELLDSEDRPTTLTTRQVIITMVLIILLAIALLSIYAFYAIYNMTSDQTRIKAKDYTEYQEVFDYTQRDADFATATNLSWFDYYKGAYKYIKSDWYRFLYLYSWIGLIMLILVLIFSICVMMYGCVQSPGACLILQLLR